MSKKMPDGVTDLGGGRYEIRATWTDPTCANRRSFERIVTAESPMAAALMREQELTRRKSGVLPGVAPVRVQLGQSMDAWLESRRTPGSRVALAESTQQTYGDALTMWKEALEADRWIDCINPAMVEMAMAWWRKAGLGTASINGRLRVLRTWAKQTRNLHVVEGVSAFSPTDEELKRHVERIDAVGEDSGRGLTDAELTKWLKHTPRVAPRWWPLLGSMWITGMRAGEATGLRVKNFDPKTGLVKIRESVWRAKFVKVPKTWKGIRDTYLVGEPLEAVCKLVRDMGRNPDPEALIFKSEESATGYVHLIGPRKAMLHACVVSDIDLAGRPALHCLRHTYNNRLRKVASEVTRQALMGHTNAETGKIYSAADAKERQEAQRKVYELMTGG